MLFELVETVENEKYFVKIFESSYYNLNVIRTKAFDYRTLEISKNGKIPFIPTIYINSQDDSFKIEVQTTSYGALNEQEFLYFIEAQQMALQYIEEIKNIIENE